MLKKSGGSLVEVGLMGQFRLKRQHLWQAERRPLHLLGQSQIESNIESNDCNGTRFSCEMGQKRSLRRDHMNHTCKNVWFCSKFQVAGSSPPVEEKSEVQSGSSSGEELYFH